MLKRQQRKHLNCPICNEPDEDIMHVMTCRSPSASELRETQLQELQLWLRSRHTDPVLTSFIIKGLRSWFRDPYGDEPLHHCPNPVTFRALTNQLELGWFALLYGYITTDITRAQHTHFWTTIGKNKATRGQSNFILNYRLLRITYGNIETKSSMRRTQCMPSAAWKSYDLRSLPNAEHTLGQDELPMPYSPFFYQPLTLLLCKSHTYLKRWFMTIKAGHESYYNQHPIVDEFTTDTSLWVWIRLSPME